MPLVIIAIVVIAVLFNVYGKRSVAKRADSVSAHVIDKSFIGITGSVVFETNAGRVVLRMDRTKYDQIVVGDTGTLTYLKDAFVSFTPNRSTVTDAS